MPRYLGFIHRFSVLRPNITVLFANSDCRPLTLSNRSVSTIPGDTLWIPTEVSPAAAKSSAKEMLSCVRAIFVLLWVQAVLENCAMHAV